MGKRGPPKKPTELKLLQGIPGGEHKLNMDEPQPDKVDENVTPTFALDEVGTARWLEMSEKLTRLGILTELDLGALTRYCDIYSKWIQAKTFIEQNGNSYSMTNKSGESYFAQYPEVSIYNSLGKDLARLEQQFGLTPAARANVKADPKKATSTLRQRLYGN